MSSIRSFSAFLGVIFLLTYSSLTLADWFLSSETKELITKADAGDAVAQFRVGSAYDTGNGAPRSGENAKKYYLMAAEQGHADAQNSLGSALQAEERYSEALPWYERAAAQGHALATNNLAFFYDLGRGVKQDRRKGFELYSRAANLGWAESMWNIANMYGAGQLGEIDLPMSCVWTFRALRFVEPAWRARLAPASRAAGFFEKTFSSDQLATCKQKANDWRPSGTTTNNAQPSVPGDAPQAARP